MLEMSNKTNLLEQRQYKYSLQDVPNPNLYRDIYPYDEIPRIAFNLDKPFKNCGACGKQALTMCMGFGCNAAGVTGCRIIDSPRERLLAILTNAFVPCNGRFPTIIAIITMFLIVGGISGSFLSAIIFTIFSISR